MTHGTHSIDRTGFFQGAGAYLMWGLLPLYFKAVIAVPAVEVLANRICWALVLLIAITAFTGRIDRLRSVFAHPRAVAMLAVSAVLICVNWLTYIWAVQNAHVLAASLGYFLNPLINVLLGMMFLGERLSRVQKMAVLLAAAGVAVLAVEAAAGLWISLTLALSFGFYGLVRKTAPAESLEGLTVEATLLLPVAGGYLIWRASHGGIALGSSPGITILLVLLGAVTAAPLLLFNAAAKRLRYATLGLLQYLAPTLQFLLAVLAFGEAMTGAHILCFTLIWIGLAIYAVDGVRSARRMRPAPIE
ncbi:EamA family transporter RarD [Stakelama sp. CBK3Z-3]|uniref:EamA family transporter RarD n=1 Tax=Stakelama flava TaxID=2860338 RepID=A0ABS6XHR0_9SPHN|nr:EamA family transporter RarD [Stakelama flava]MBW4329712.1 EamA family transporter RarD [Stakelama flava]